MFVFFDIDGTLVDYKYAEKAGAIEFDHQHTKFFDISEDTFVQIWSDLAHKYFKEYLSNKLSFSLQRQKRMKELFTTAGMELSDHQADCKFHEYLAYYQSKLKPFEDVVPCLKKLNPAKLGIITNGDYQHQVDKLQRTGLLDYFSIIVTSSKIGYSKPDKRLFIEACNLVNKSPSSSFYVGDDFETDILGCNAAEMKGIWINRLQEVRGKQIYPNEITSLHSLPSILGVNES